MLCKRVCVVVVVVVVAAALVVEVVVGMCMKVCDVAVEIFVQLVQCKKAYVVVVEPSFEHSSSSVAAHLSVETY